MAAATQNPLEAFIWGAGGSKKTPEEIARDKEIAAELLMKAGNTSPVQHWTQGAARVADALSGVIKQKRAERAGEENATYNQGILSELFKGGSTPAASAPASASSAIPASGASAEIASSAPDQPINMTGNEVYSGFMDTVKGGVQNPYALAAIAATGQRESQFAPGNVNRTWSDPSQSGQPGTAGGIMSWRGPRYQALAATGDLSPQGQAKFFLQENPQLIQALNNAGSVEEAQSLMNKAWAFAGYDKPGGETAKRLAAAQGFLPTFQASGEVAAATPQAAIEAISPTQGGSLTDEVAAFEQTPAYAAQFPGRQPTEQPAMAAQQPTAVQQVAQVLPTAGQTQQAVPGMSEALLRAISDPRATPQTRAVAQALMQQQAAQQAQAAEQQQWLAWQQYEQQARQNDPSTRLDMDYKRAQMEALKAKPQEPWQKLDDDTLFRPATGETRELTAPGPDGKAAFRFGGSSVEAQALNGLMDAGTLTAAQAQQLGAGKTVTGPNGELLFMTPQGVFGAKSGEAPQPLQGGSATQRDGGMIPLTEPKVTIDEKKAMTFADRMAASGAIIDDMGMKGSGKGDRLAGSIPLVGEYFTSDEYKKVDAAKRDFVNAQLRRESGAAIGKDEFDNAEKQYFPQPNDTPEVIDQKRLLRQRVIDGMKRDAGPTYSAPEIKLYQGGGEIKTDIPGVKIRRKN